MLSAGQLEERRKGVTATDIGKLVGQSPYGCALDVLMDKQGIGRPFIEHERVKWGNILEDPIRQDYAKRHGVRVVEGGTLRHPTEPWALATPDGLIYGDTTGLGPRWGHEIKTHTSWLSHLYGEPGTDEVPSWELIQCAWNIWVCSAFYGVQIDRWDLTVFLDGLPIDYTIIRDPELEEALVSAGREFWDRNVIGGEELPPDGSEHYSEILKARWPTHSAETVEATAAQVVTIQELKEAREAEREAKELVVLITQELQVAIGETGGLEWSEIIGDKAKTQRITWKRSKDSERCSWKSVAQELMGYIPEILMLGEAGIPDVLSGGEDSIREGLEEIVNRHKATSEGSRRFVVPRTWGKK